MVSIPNRSSDSLARAIISARVGAIHRSAAGLLLGLLAALIVGAAVAYLADNLDASSSPNFIPFEDPIALSSFTA